MTTRDSAGREGEPPVHHRPGFYMRALREGHIQASDQIIKTVPRGELAIIWDLEVAINGGVPHLLQPVAGR